MDYLVALQGGYYLRYLRHTCLELVVDKLVKDTSLISLVGKGSLTRVYNVQL